MTVSAESVQPPKYEIHGNKCGKVIVDSNIDRDVQITITQLTPDGNFNYYESVIPSDNNEEPYSFILEGKNDISYKIKIGVSKYKSSNSLQYFEDAFIIYDTDDIVEDVLGYEYKYLINAGEELTSKKMIDCEKNENNIIQSEINVDFPISDYILGDINLDGQVDIADTSFLQKYLVNKETAPIYENADIDGNGIVNVFDLIILKRSILNLVK